MRGRFAVAVLLLLAGGAGSAVAADGAKELDEAWVRAINANDLEAVVALYADDATYFPPDAPEAQGKTAIRAIYSAMLGANTVSEAKIEEAHYRSSGDLSTSWGEASLTLKPKAGGDAQTVKVRFTAVTTRRGGKWLYLVDHASVPLPPPPPAR